MPAKKIDGKEIAASVRSRAAEEAAALAKTGRAPCLAVILVGEDPASAVYVNNKKKACAACGITSLSFELPADTTEEALLERIAALNADPSVDGILCQLPLPRHIRETAVLEAISPEKDVDGFHPVNVGKLVSGAPGFLPCTPAGVIEMLRYEKIPVAGKKAVVIGRSNIVGKPVSLLLLRENATVTVCHSHTENLKETVRAADIVVAAVGKPGFVTADMVKPGAAVIDVGINRLPDGKLSGDVDYEGVSPVAGWITPVPGGVGPMTIAMLMHNTVQAYKMKNNIK